MDAWWPTAAAGALFAWMHLRLVVPRLREPDDDVPGWTKPPYRTLPTPALQGAAVALGAGAGVVAATAAPPTQPLLLVLAGPAAALVLVDLRTTYLPRQLTHWCWALASAAGGLGLLLAAQPVGMASRLVGGALGSALLFWVLWRAGAGIGFGDVRLAPLLGAAAAAESWTAWQACLVLGPLLGALAGLVTWAWRRSHPHALGSVFAYGPWLWGGLWPALLLT